MPLAVHHGSEIGKTLVAVIAAIIFVVIGLTFLPELIAPGGGTEGQATVGQTTRMIR